METLFENQFAKITYDKTNKTLTQEWYGFASTEKFIEVINISVEACKTHKVEKILSDTRQQAVLKKDATDYAASVMPKLMESGLQKMAFVQPDSIFTKMSVEHFKAKVDTQNVQHFADPETAIKWLNN